MKSQIPDAFYKSFFDSASDGMILADLETRKFYIANKAICKMLGYEYEEIKNLTVADIHPKENLPYVMERFERQAKGKIGESILAEDMPMKRKDGSVFYANINAFRVKLAERMYLAGVFRDTTERRRTEKDLENAKVAARNVLEDLQLEKERLAFEKAKDEAMLASIGEGLVVVDMNMRIILINKAAEAVTGWSSQEVLNKVWPEVIMLETEDGQKVPVNESPLSFVLHAEKTTTTTTTTTYYYTRKNQTKFPAAITVSPVKLDNKLIGAVLVFRDMTKERKIEKMRLDFLALASHQLRTPLSGTKWLIETMQRGVLGKMTPRQKDYLCQLYGINERMIRLVSDMLNVLRLESGVVSMEKEDISILKLYDDLILTMKIAAKEKGWVVIRNLLKNKKDVRIETDIQILNNILDCFVSNAINYSIIGQEVVLDAREEKAFVIFSVKDSGIGIPKEEQRQIFERFYRASNAKKVKPSGTGLGLYTAAMLAEKIGGKIWFESKEGKGTTFYLRVPK